MTTVLWLVRHGETMWNRERRFQGQLDVPLSPEGEAQATALGRRLRDLDPDLTAAWSSDLSRCAETARLILAERADPLSLRARLDPGLRESHLGEWQGRPIEEVRAGRTAADPRRREDPDFAPPGGESANQVGARISAAIDRIAASHVGGQILIVTHGGALRAYLATLLGLGGRLRIPVRVDNCGLTEIHLTPSPRLRRLNDLAHLGGHMGTTGTVATA